MIYLLRHGLDDENYVGGWSDVSLIDIGISQIENISKYLKENNITFEKIYTSDVKRAIETSTIISNEFNIEINKLPILRELNKGILNGMELNKAKKLYSMYFKGLNINTKYPNGECMKELYDRIKSNLAYILSLDNSLLVTHRGVINMIYYILNDIDLDMNKKRFNVTHASLHQLDVEKKKIKRIY